MSDKHVVAALQRTVADLELRLREVARERDEAYADRARARVDRDEARAEVERLRFIEDCRGDGLTYECNLTRLCVTCRLSTVAKRQREACARRIEALVSGPESVPYFVSLDRFMATGRAAEAARSAALVTDTKADGGSP